MFIRWLSIFCEFGPCSTINSWINLYYWQIYKDISLIFIHIFYQILSISLHNYFRSKICIKINSFIWKGNFCYFNALLCLFKGQSSLNWRFIFISLNIFIRFIEINVLPATFATYFDPSTLNEPFKSVSFVETYLFIMFLMAEIIVLMIMHLLICPIHFQTLLSCLVYPKYRIFLHLIRWLY